jgi:RNA polymerase sigma factor (sigma-70 family)
VLPAVPWAIGPGEQRVAVVGGPGRKADEVTSGEGLARHTGEPVRADVEPIRVAILGKNRLFAEGLRRILASDPSLAVVAEVEPEKVSEVARRTTASILLADVTPDVGLPLCRELRREGARPWIILLSGDGDEDGVVRALESGARGVLPKNATAETLMKAIRAVHAGQIWASKTAIARIVEQLASRSLATHRMEDALSQRLSRREQEIVRQTAQGLSNQEVADRLGISEATVKAHLTRIFQKLGVRDRGQLLAFYHRSRASGAAESGATR